MFEGLQCLYAESLYSVLDPSGHGSIDARWAVEKLLSSDSFGQHADLATTISASATASHRLSRVEFLEITLATLSPTVASSAATHAAVADGCADALEDSIRQVYAEGLFAILDREGCGSIRVSSAVQELLSDSFAAHAEVATAVVAAAGARQKGINVHCGRKGANGPGDELLTPRGERDGELINKNSRMLKTDFVEAVLQTQWGCDRSAPSNTHMGGFISGYGLQRSSPTSRPPEYFDGETACPVSSSTAELQTTRSFIATIESESSPQRPFELNASCGDVVQAKSQSCKEDCMQLSQTRASLDDSRAVPSGNVLPKRDASGQRRLVDACSSRLYGEARRREERHDKLRSEHLAARAAAEEAATAQPTVKRLYGAAEEAACCSRLYGEARRREERLEKLRNEQLALRAAAEEAETAYRPLATATRRISGGRRREDTGGTTHVRTRLSKTSYASVKSHDSLEDLTVLGVFEDARASAPTIKD